MQTAIHVLAAMTLGVSASVCTQACAEPSRFTNDGLVVLEATRFVNEPSGTAFLSNQEFTFTLQSSGPSASTPSTAVSVRIFALRPRRNVPEFLEVFDPCWVYLSNILPVRVNPSGAINLGLLTQYWLRATRGGSMEDGRYLLVFERGTGDGHGLFRLRNGERADYFKHGLIVEVRPSRPFSQPEIDAQAIADAQYSSVVTMRARENNASSKCYLVRLGATGTNEEQAEVKYASSDECEQASLTQ